MWEQSAKSGIPYSIFMLHYAVKKLYTKDDADKAFQQLLVLAENGNYRDKWRVGRIYHAGYGVPINGERILFWHLQAAKGGWAGKTKCGIVF